jgi:hypothetical protein
MKKTRTKMTNMNPIKCFFAFLLIGVIIYLSVKPSETFHENFSEGLDVSKNIVFVKYIDKAIEKPKEPEKAAAIDITVTGRGTTTTTQTQDEFLWYDLDTYTSADIAYASIIFILFFILLILISKMTERENPST